MLSPVQTSLNQSVSRIHPLLSAYLKSLRQKVYIPSNVFSSKMGLIKKLILLFFLLVVVFAAYSSQDLIKNKINTFLDMQPSAASLDQNQVPAPPVVAESVTSIVVENTSCRINGDCPQGKLCIDGNCQTISSLYTTDCENKCSFSNLTFTTSDGESYTLKEGQGTYTAAGALEWKVSSVPDFCPEEDLVVPLYLYKKNFGKTVEEEVITLKQGQTSNAITHPSMPALKFTVTLQQIKTICSS